MSETVKFTVMFDRFFDCLNVNNFTTGKHKRKPFQNPYRSPDDFRLKVCVCVCVVLKRYMYTRTCTYTCACTCNSKHTHVHVYLCFTPSVATRRFPRLSARLGRECVTENWLYREGERQNAIIC